MSRFTDDLAGAAERRACPWDGAERTARECASEDARLFQAYLEAEGAERRARERWGDAIGTDAEHAARLALDSASDATRSAYRDYRVASNAIEADTEFGEWVRLAERRGMASGKSGPAFERSRAREYLGQSDVQAGVGDEGEDDVERARREIG